MGLRLLIVGYSNITVLAIVTGTAKKEVPFFKIITIKPVKISTNLFIHPANQEEEVQLSDLFFFSSRLTEAPSIFFSNLLDVRNESRYSFCNCVAMFTAAEVPME